MGKQRYTDEDRAKALAIFDACGGNYSQASRDSGVPRATLQEWAAGRVSDAVPDIRQARRGDIAAMFADFVTRAIDLTTDEDIKAARIRDRFAAIGVAVDKMRLLNDQPTEIVKSQSDVTARIAAYESAFRGAAAREEEGFVPGDGDRKPLAAANGQGRADRQAG